MGSLFVKHAELEAAAAAAPPQDSSDGMSSNLWLRTLSECTTAVVWSLLQHAGSTGSASITTCSWPWFTCACACREGPGDTRLAGSTGGSVSSGAKMPLCLLLGMSAGQSGAAIALMIFTFIFFWFVCGLSGFHTWLVATNQTTYENFRWGTRWCLPPLFGCIALRTHVAPAAEFARCCALQQSKQHSIWRGGVLQTSTAGACVVSVPSLPKALT